MNRRYRNLFLILITWKLILASSVSAQTCEATGSGRCWYVSNTSTNCSNTGPGSYAVPLCDITTANNRHNGGDVVYILPGEYRERLVPKAGLSNSQRTVYSGYGDRSQIKVLGSEVVSGWQSCAAGAGCPVTNANIYRASFEGGTVDRPNSCNVERTSCWLDRTTWFRRAEIAQNDTINQLDSPGEYFYDRNANQVYIWMPDSSNPNVNHTIECAKRPVLAMGEYTNYLGFDGYFTLQNLTILQSFNGGARFGLTRADPGYITIQNNEFAFTSGEGFCGENPAVIYQGNADDATPIVPGYVIKGNIIRDYGSDKGPYNDPRLDEVHAGSGISFYTVKDSLIEDNQIYHGVGGIGLKTGNANVTIKNNVLHDIWNGIWEGKTTRVTGIYHFEGTIEGNLIYNTVTGANGYAVYNDAGNTRFNMFNNTFYNTAGIRMEMDGSVDQHSNTYMAMRNNIISNIHSSQDGTIFLGMYRTSLPTSTLNFNRYFHPTALSVFAATGTSGGQVTYPTLANWQSVTSQDANSRYENPQFVDPGALNFALQSGSPAINQGTFIPGFHCQFADDNGGSGLTNCRHWCGSNPDVGAFEYCPSSGDTSPPAPPGGLSIQ